MKNFHTLGCIVLCCLLALPLTAQKDITGKYVYIDKNQTPLKGVTVFLKDLDGNILEKTTTDENGKYVFKNIEKGNYTIEGDPNYDKDYGTVNFKDLYAIKKHITGEKKLEGFFLKTADVDGSGTIDWDDYNYFRYDWFVEQKEFPIGKWVFETRNITEDTWALKDDPRGSGAPGGEGDDDGGNGGTLPPDIKDSPLNQIKLDFINTLNIEDASNVTIPMYLNEESVEGFGMVLNYNSEAIEIHSIDSDLDIEYTINNGQIRLSYFNSSFKTSTIASTQPLLRISMSLKDVLINTSELFSVDKASHFINSNGDIIPGIRLEMPNIKNTEEESSLVGVFPNPVKSYSKIKYKLVNTSMVLIRIYNTNGQLIQELVNETQAPGHYDVELNINNLSLSNGNYICRFDCHGEKLISDSKMIIINK